ncbi:TIGR01777 family oxidoreductase [Arthrobacter sp. H14-L1]|uniref:TIGR01777 family oxidoreductase n=1 Tax=Arthrobacter sp. H14-L1 TaxID=2996697 RepID=UPI0022711792|nr:TIGR01777 family oxidoreductase [Arthrobacter sp. H14-L1]MCY0904272.1 TIGR01777 family oxidoreductase [Arthrobacter sp. H14-L1]
MRILISGASGLLGSASSLALTRAGHHVIKLVRRSAQRPDEVQWDPARQELDPRRLEGIDAVINLSGAGLANRPWTRGYVETLYESRVDPTRTLVRAMARMQNPPSVFLSQSGTGYYGEADSTSVDESFPSAEDSLLADICRRWEDAAFAAPQEVRTVVMRTGVVVTRRGGAIGKLLLPLKLGLGGPLGSGQQYWPWISLPDDVAAMEFLLRTEIRGPVNLCAPEPAQVGALVEELGKAFGKPSRLRVPKVVLTTLLGEMAKETLLTSTRAVPGVLLEHGFTFQHPTAAAVAAWVGGPEESTVI